MVERPSWAVSDTDGIITTEDGRVQVGGGVFLPDGTAPASSRSGFLPGPTSPGQVTASATADNNVHIAAFQRVFQSTRGQGPYIQTLDAEKTIDILTDHPADSTNDRHDLIVAQQSDAFYGDTANTFLIRHVVGTAASTPSDPTVDGSPDYYELARVRVTAGATEITDSMIDDLRPPESTVALGGVLPVADQAERDAIPSPYEGMTVYRADTDWVETRSLNAWRTPWFVSTPDLSNVTDPMTGTFAHDESDNTVYRWDGSAWVEHRQPRPFGHAGHTTGFQDISESGNIVTLDTLYDARGGMSLSDNGIVVPRAGLYRITAQAYFSGTGGVDGWWHVEVNGSDAGARGRLWKETSQDYINGSTVTRSLASGDIVRLWHAYTGNTWGTTGYDGAYLEVALDE